MKYGYNFMDWSLFEIDELEEVTELDEDYIQKDCFGTHLFKKDEWCWVKCTKPIFLKPISISKHIETNEGLYYKEHIFDTREEAEAYGRKHSSLNW